MAGSRPWKILKSMGYQQRGPTLCGLHDLPQPACNDRLHFKRCKPDPEGRRRQILCHLFLREWTLQPEPSDLCQDVRALDDTVLPSVPLWRSERSQQHQQYYDAIPVNTFKNHGERYSLPLFSDLFPNGG